VLLKGVNDCPVVMRKLVHELVKVRCRPYYIYACDLSEGLSHFRTTVGKGLEIMESLRGHTSGYAVPTFVVDAPGGGGKIPVMPNYLLAQADGKVYLRNFEGKISVYHEGTPANHVENGICKVCGTDHSAINVGVAAELARTKPKAGIVPLPENVQRIGAPPSLIPLEMLDQIEQGTFTQKPEAGDD
jgi:lysine 2,3-aminomutase